jgi:hypothetical protein
MCTITVKRSQNHKKKEEEDINMVITAEIRRTGSTTENK